MTPLPAALGGDELVAWRLDNRRHAATWDSGEGAYIFGGRWNPKGTPAVYCSIDPATTILEQAVHKDWSVLDVVPHVLTTLTVTEPAAVHVVRPEDVPDADWLAPGLPDTAQQAFGAILLSLHKFILIPSVVSSHSWNLILSVPKAAGAYTLESQTPFVLDKRLSPPSPS